MCHREPRKPLDPKNPIEFGQDTYFGKTEAVEIAQFGKVAMLVTSHQNLLIDWSDLAELVRLGGKALRNDPDVPRTPAPWRDDIDPPHPDASNH
jgi:hypothetical protein